MGNISCTGARESSEQTSARRIVFGRGDGRGGAGTEGGDSTSSEWDIDAAKERRDHIINIAAAGPAEVAAQLLSEEHPKLAVGIAQAFVKQDFEAKDYLMGTAMRDSVAGLCRLLAHDHHEVVAAALRGLCSVAKDARHTAHLLDNPRVLPEVCRVAGRPDAHRDVVFWAFTLFYHLLRPDGHHVNDDRADLLADAGVAELCADILALRGEDVEIRAHVHEVQRVLV